MENKRDLKAELEKLQLFPADGVSSELPIPDVKIEYRKLEELYIRALLAEAMVRLLFNEIEALRYEANSDSFKELIYRHAIAQLRKERIEIETD